MRLPMVAVESIGAGGGSIAYADAAGALKVGPRSAGAVPGPACYGAGGDAPTVTDANALLGYLNLDRLYGGSIRLDAGRAEPVIEALGARFGLSRLDAAHGVVEVANSNMLRAIRLVSVQRGYDLRRFTLIAYGGAGPIHAGALARMAGVSRVIVPAHSGAFSALGCLVSPLRYDAVQTYRARLDAFDPKPLEDRFRELEVQCTGPILDDGVPADGISVFRSVDLRYVGQNYELEIPYDRDAGRLRAAFEARHRQLYGYATGEGVECVNARVTALVPGPDEHDETAAATKSRPVSTGHQRAYFRETGEVRVERYARETLSSAHPVTGPALVEDDWSTTIVYPGQRCTRTAAGDLILEVG
jgi:N-methylhydantoinase A